MFAKVVIVFCAVAAISALPDNRPSTGFGYQPPQPPQPSYSQPQPSYQQREEGMPFNFAYEVKDDHTGNDFSHNSESDGHVTKGEYRVLLPDSRTQIVTYVADHEGGYNAEVTYEGEARYDEPDQRSYSNPQPSYEQPRPSYQQPRQSYGF